MKKKPAPKRTKPRKSTVNDLPPRKVTAAAVKGGKFRYHIIGNKEG